MLYNRDQCSKYGKGYSALTDLLRKSLCNFYLELGHWRMLTLTFINWPRNTNKPYLHRLYGTGYITTYSKCEDRLSIKLMKGKALRKHSLHQKTAASVLLKLFISSNEWCHTTPHQFLDACTCTPSFHLYARGVRGVASVITIDKQLK